jgi:hypothetical protein
MLKMLKMLKKMRVYFLSILFFWTNKLIWGDNKLILSSLKNGFLREEIEAQQVVFQSALCRSRLRTWSLEEGRCWWRGCIVEETTPGFGGLKT